MKLIRSIRRRPSSEGFGILVGRADKANAARDWAAAAKYYKAALEMDHAHPALWIQYGHSLKERGFLLDAEDAYRRAALLDGGNADAHLQLGHVLKLQGAVEKSIAAYEAAHRSDPSLAHGRSELEALRTQFSGPITRDAHLAGGRSCFDEGSPKIDEHFVKDVQANFRSKPDGIISLDRTLSDAGLKTGVLAQFDPFFYFYANRPVQAAVLAPNLNACIVHFCRIGLEACLPISGQSRFDAEFYTENGLDGMPFTPANAYRHWINQGMVEGAAPNKESWIQAHAGDVGDAIDLVDLKRFAATTGVASVEILRWTQLAQHFVNHALRPESHAVPTEATARLYETLASRAEQAGGMQGNQAFRMRQLLSLRVPGDRVNRQRYAQSLIDRGMDAAAIAILEQDASQDDPSALTLLRLSECQTRLALFDQAMQTAGRARQAFPGDQFLVRHYRNLAAGQFDRAWDLATALGRAGQVDEGRALVGDACLRLATELSAAETQPGRPIRRVAIIGNSPLPQCKFYRIDQKIEQLEAAGFQADMFDMADDPDAFIAAASQFDAAIFFRVPALPGVVTAIAKARELGLVTFYDMDDLIFGSHYPESLESYTGVTQDEHLGLAMAAPLFESAIRLCQYGIASTETLAGVMRSLVSSGKVFVHPNALGAVHVETARALHGLAPSPGVVTIFYGSGTKAHKADFKRLIEPALVAAVAAHRGKVRIVLMGEFQDSDDLDSIADHLTVFQPMWDIKAYWSILAAADINLAPLQPNAVTDAKSEIKWLEAAMLGIPSIVSNTATYNDVIVPGETGLICRDASEWTQAINRLVRDAQLRHHIGRQARQAAEAVYGPANMAGRIAEMFKAVSPPQDTRPTIVIVNVFYPPQAIGGATRVVHDNVRAIRAGADDRFRIEVFTTIDGGDPYRVNSYVQDGVRVTGVGTPHHADLEYRAADTKMGAVFGAFLDTTRPALVHFHCIQRLTASVAAAAAERGIPYVITVHDGWWISDHQFLLDQSGSVQTYDFNDPIGTLQRHGARSYNRLVALQAALRGARHVLAVSDRFAELHRACGVPRVVSCPNGVATLPVRPRQPGPDGRVRLAFIGGLARHKGYDLIQIALRSERFEHLSLLLIDHSLQPGMARSTVWGATPVEFRAKYNQATVADLYASIDVLLAPSMWPESFGLVTREALASGCWVIASDRGSIGDCIEHGKNGYIVDVSTIEGLMRALRDVDNNPERFRSPPGVQLSLRRQSQQAEELMALYTDILGQAAPAMPPGQVFAGEAVGQVSP